ncbi:MAG: prepilin-type N-terminal cleavage/methylation domain-containing protein [Verrucomicrobiae bacterium]|nr:prepilin-type N-terminal cleavage/methylation domain-containing protein [Verrucomicrobiae bacterium]
MTLVDHRPMKRDATTTRRALHTAGFTLVELLIILLIIGVLAALVIPGYSTASASPKSAAAVALQ